MECNQTINGNCWLACFDILGFKKRILGFEQTYGVGKLDRFADFIYKNEILDTLQCGVKNLNGRVFTCWGSDTFVFYTPDDSVPSFIVISMLAFKFCCRKIRQSPSYMLRGALGTGQFYADKQNNVFLGSALIDAYEYAEKQNWIGFVITPSAEKKLTQQPSQNLLYQYVKYDVPVKKMESKNGIKCIVKDTEQLFAAKIQDSPAIGNFFQPRNTDVPQKEWVEKYENTRRFFEKYPKEGDK